MALNRRYIPAKAVEAILETLLDYTEPEVYSDPWHNGRENGFCFWRVADGPEGGTIAVYVAEHRISDDICITLTDSAEWSQCTDEQYKAREYFGYDQHYLAAKRVVELLQVREKEC